MQSWIEKADLVDHKMDDKLNTTSIHRFSVLIYTKITTRCNRACHLKKEANISPKAGESA